MLKQTRKMPNIKINNISRIIALIFVLFACKPNPVWGNVPVKYGSETAVKWADMTLYVIKSSVKNSPTYGSRSMAYIGLTMYETVVNGSPMHQSMSGQLADMPVLPKPMRRKNYNWTLAMNAGQSFIIKKLYEHASPPVMGRLDSLASDILKTASIGEKQATIDRSVQFGEAVAAAIFEWSKTDGGHQGYLRNFDPNFVFPTTPGSWTVPIRGQTSSAIPLHNNWGKNRSLLKINDLLPVPDIIPHSTDPKSACYAQFFDVYKKNKILTTEEKEIAVWWSDDPAETAAPPGHSYNLATITIKKAQPDLFKAAETYARTGIAVCDAFINCWRCKYTHFSQRPEPYIIAHIDPAFVMFWPEPPFPSFSSGHATQGGAAAAVLTDLYGTAFKFTDNTHEGREPNAKFSTGGGMMDASKLIDLANNPNGKKEIKGIEYKPRSFNSFEEAAEEIAYSRFLGGIHAQQDNVVGLQEGRKIGQNVNALKWRK